MLLSSRRGDDLMARVGELLQLCIAAETEPDRGARFAIIETQRAQHMTRPPRAAGAGRTERKRNVPKVREQPRGVDAVAADVEIALVAALNATVDGPVRPECLHRRGPQPLHI